jgi:hypothetical protein
MLAREAQRVDQRTAGAAALDPNVRGLLDHIAAELAEEYIRLMDAAAEAEAGGPGADGEAIGGDER